MVSTEPPSGGEVSKSLERLSLKQRQPIADSWEDDASSDEDSANNTSQKKDEEVEIPPTIRSNPKPVAPSQDRPHTPARAGESEQLFGPDGLPLSPRLASGTQPPPNTPDLRGGPSAARLGSASDNASARPEKTVAPAARMIAGALGVRAPKRTEEQRAYDAAIRKQELKRREEERDKVKREQAEKEKARQDIWDA